MRRRRQAHCPRGVPWGVGRRWAMVLALAAAALAPAGPPGAAARAEEADAEASHGADIRPFDVPPTHGLLSMPSAATAQGEGRLAVVILVHDALGPDIRGSRYVAQLTGAGIAVLELLAGAEDPAQALPHAAAALAADARFDGARIGVLGFGSGGAAAVVAEAPFAARAALYPGCATLAAGIAQAPDLATTPLAATPLLLLHGGADPANPPAACDAAARALVGHGAAVRRIEYAGAGFAWDYPAFGKERRVLLPAPGTSGRIPAQPWPELADLSATQVAGFFARALPPGGAGRQPPRPHRPAAAGHDGM